MNYFKQKLTIATVLVVIFLTVVVLVILPTLRDIFDLRQKILIQKAELEERYNRRISIKLALQNLKDIQNEFKEMSGRIFASPGSEIDFIMTLEELANQHNLEQKLRLEVGLKTNLGKTRQVEIPLFLDITGSYINLIKYFEMLEKSKLFVAPVTLEIRSADKDEKRGLINARIQARTYWFE